MTEPTLLPCPFCGSQLVPSLGLPDGTYQHADNVRECIIGDLAVTDKDFWNRRAFAADALDAADARITGLEAMLAAAQAEVERLREALEKICEPITVAADAETVVACQDLHDLICDIAQTALGRTP